MDDTAQHWTLDSTEDYLHAISSDFVRAIETAMGDNKVTQGQLAERLGVSESRVSQVLNNPGNLTLRKIIEYSRALRVKVAVVLYDDDAKKGPIPSEIFSKCWQRLGGPRDFFEFDTCNVVTDSTYHVFATDAAAGFSTLAIDFAQIVGATSAPIGTFFLNIDESSSTPLPAWPPHLPQNARRTQ